MNPTQEPNPNLPETQADTPALERPGWTETTSYTLTAAGYRAVEDPFELARLLPDVVTKPGGHHPECCCLACDDVAESWGENELDHDRIPTREGFLAWRATNAGAVETSAAEPVPVRTCARCGESMPGAYTWNAPLCPDCVPPCRCGDNGCEDTFGKATAGQDRSGCCQYCGYYDCDVCGWTATAQPSGSADEPGSVPDVLRSAARYLELHGWIQGAYYDATAGVFTPAACVVGAIAMVCYGGPVDAPAQLFDQPGFAEFEAAVLHLDRYLLVEGGSEAYEFNDARGRTVGDILHALRQAAATPESELLDALKAIDEANEWLANSGLTADQITALLKGGDAR